MKAVVIQNGKKEVLTDLSFAQSKQAAAIMDCIGRLIPHEGVDYEVEVIFKSAYDPSVSLSITALTDKGEMWKAYLMQMIKKYPPTVDFQGEILPENPEPPEEPENSQEEENNELKEAEG